MVAGKARLEHVAVKVQMYQGSSYYDNLNLNYELEEHTEQMKILATCVQKDAHFYVT